MDTIAEAKKRKARLSPINVLFVKSEGAFDPVFTGEAAALDAAAAAKQAINAKIPSASPETADFGLLEKLPEAKDFDRIVVIMDGTTTSRTPLRVLKDWGDTGKKITLLITTPKCPEWAPIECVQIGTGSREVQAVAKPIADKLNALVEQPPAPGTPAPPRPAKPTSPTSPAAPPKPSTR